MFGWLLGRDDRAWRMAALHYMGDRLPNINRFDPTQAEVDRAVVQLAKAREWLSSVEDREMRRQCEKWCNHMDWQIAKAKEELKTGAIRKRDADNRQRWAEEDAA